MQNVQMKVNGNTLTITIDLSAPQTGSKTGKSNIVATTSGNVSVPGKPEMKLGLNLYTPRG
jgi:hypothetical protein